MDSTTTPSNNKQAHVPTLDDWARFNKKRAAEKTARKAARRDAKKAAQTAVEQAVHGTPDGEPQEEIIDPAVLAWQAKLERQLEHEDRNWRQKEEQWEKEAAKKALARQEEGENTPYTHEGEKQPESPPSAPQEQLSEEATIAPPSVAVECEEGNTPPPAAMSVRKKEQRQWSRRSQPDRAYGTAETIMSGTSSDAHSTATTTWKTDKEHAVASSDSIVATTATLKTKLCESDSEAVTPIAATTLKTEDNIFLWRLTDPRQRAFMLAMGDADCMPDDGDVRHDSAANRRRNAQYSVFLAAWQYIFPGDSTDKLYTRFSSWVNDIARHIPEKQEGEHLLLQVFGTVREMQEAGEAIDSPKGIINRAVLDSVRFEEKAPPTKAQKLRQHSRRKAAARRLSDNG